MISTSRRFIRLPNSEFIQVEEQDAVIVFKADGSEEFYIPGVDLDAVGVDDDDAESEPLMTEAAAKAFACASLLSDPLALLETLDALGIECDVEDAADEG